MRRKIVQLSLYGVQRARNFPANLFSLLLQPFLANNIMENSQGHFVDLPER